MVAIKIPKLLPPNTFGLNIYQKCFAALLWILVGKPQCSQTSWLDLATNFRRILKGGIRKGREGRTKEIRKADEWRLAPKRVVRSAVPEMQLPEALFGWPECPQINAVN